MIDFPHLKIATYYSPGYGCNNLSEIAQACVREGISTIGIRDEESMTAAAEGDSIFEEHGIKAIYGTNLQVKPYETSDIQTIGLLAETQQGWSNLLEIFSESHNPEECWRILRGRSEGICGFLPEGFWFSDELKEEAVAAFEPECLYLELQAVHLPGESPRLCLSESACSDILCASEASGIPLAAVWDVRYADKHHKATWRTIACIERKHQKDEIDALWTSEDKAKREIRSPSEAAAPFLAAEERGESALKNSQKIASRAEQIKPFAKKGALPSPPDYSNANADKTLRDLVAKLAPERWQNIPEDRLAKELDVICEAGYAKYFLIVYETIDWCKKQGIGVGPGRGSAAGCAVAYALRICDADPIEHGLLFERFLNRGRKQMPDIDIDFEDIRRSEVIEHLRDTYGDDAVGQVVVFSEFKSKNSLKDVARISGYQPADQDAQASRVPDAIAGVQPKLSMMLSPYPPKTSDDDQITFWKRGDSLRELEGSEKNVADEASTLEGRIRHFGVHAAAVIISDAPIRTYIPCKQQDGFLVAQYSAKDCEKAGLLKLDVLGLKMVRILERSIQALGIDYSDIPDNDREVMGMLSLGDTDGVFQMESYACRNMCKLVQPSHFRDIVAIAAMNRPGPLASKTHEKYAAAVKGDMSHLEELPHQDLEELLKETYGLLLYQEQIMQIGEYYAGMTLEQTDEMRRITGKKDRDAMAKMKEEFSRGCSENGHSRDIAEELWHWIEPFGSYGFNKSHAVAYSIISYHSAWLACHHPAVFFAELSRAAGDVERSGRVLGWARKKGVKIYPPSIAEPVVRHTPTSDQKGIRFGIGDIKGVGSSAVGLWKEFSDGGSFSDNDDLSRRFPALQSNKRTRDALSAAGVLLPFGRIAAQTDEGKTSLAMLGVLHDAEQSEGQEDFLQLPDMENVCGIRIGGETEEDNPPGERGWKSPGETKRLPPRSPVGMWGVATGGEYKVSKNKRPYYMFMTVSEDGKDKIKAMKMLPPGESSWADQPPDGSRVYVSGDLNDNPDSPLVFVSSCQWEDMPMASLDKTIWSAQGVKSDPGNLSDGYLIDGVERTQVSVPSVSASDEISTFDISDKRSAEPVITASSQNGTLF